MIALVLETETQTQQLATFTKGWLLYILGHTFHSRRLNLAVREEENTRDKVRAHR